MAAKTYNTKSTKSPNNKRKFDTSKSNNNNNNDDDTRSASNKKRALKHARQAHRPHAETVIAAKELWNKLRLKSNSPAEITAHATELVKLLQGKFHRVAMQHDASRVVQAAIQFGNTEQRFQIVQEICAEGDLMELAKVQYAHFVVLKMIKYCAREEPSLKLIVKVSLVLFLIMLRAIC